MAYSLASLFVADAVVIHNVYLELRYSELKESAIKITKRND